MSCLHNKYYVYYIPDDVSKSVYLCASLGNNILIRISRPGFGPSLHAYLASQLISIVL